MVLAVQHPDNDPVVNVIVPCQSSLRVSHRSAYLYNRKTLKTLAMNGSIKKNTTDYHRWWPFVILIKVYFLLCSGQRHRPESVIVPSQSSLRVSHCIEMSEKEEYGVVSSKSILKMLAMNDSFKKKTYHRLWFWPFVILIMILWSTSSLSLRVSHRSAYLYNRKI
jgi:hypothetical protein